MPVLHLQKEEQRKVIIREKRKKREKRGEKRKEKKRKREKRKEKKRKRQVLFFMSESKKNKNKIK